MTNTYRLRRSILLGSAAGIACSLGSVVVPALASAQTVAAAPAPSANPSGRVLEEVVVTAERRTSNLQKTAASVTVERGTDLLQRGKYSLASILETVPNVTGGDADGVSTQPTGNDTPATGITIRGLASNLSITGLTIAGVSAVAVYVDDVYGGIGGDYDLDRVEVLRGPQGTLYGRSATAGLIAIHTNNPDLKNYGGSVALEGGSYGLIHATGTVNIPIVADTLALRIAVNHYQRNAIDAVHGVGADDLSEARAKLLYKPTDNFSVLAGAAMQNKTLYNGGFVANLNTPNQYTYSSFQTGSADLKDRQFWAEANLDVGGLRLTYLPSYRTWTQNATVYVAGFGGGTFQQTVVTPHDEFLTQELRLASALDSPIKWQTGLFYFYNDISSNNLDAWESSGGLAFHAVAERKTSDTGVFGEATVPVTDKLRLTGGVRYDTTTVTTTEVYTSNANFACNTPTGPAFGCAAGPPGSANAGLPENDQTVSISGNQGRRQFNNITFKARAEYDLAPDSLLYGMVSTAFLPGDVQVGTGTNGPAVFPYASEQLTAYEIGSKNRFLDQRLQVNLGVFHYEYAGYQASIQTNPLNPGSALLFSVPLRMTGGELETQYQLTPNDRIGFNLSEVSTAFHNLPPQFSNAVAQSGMWGFSPTTATVLYDHELTLPNGSSLDFHGEGTWKAAYYVNYLNPSLVAGGGLAWDRQNAFVQGNVSATWTPADGNFSVTGYVRNVGNERYKTQVGLQQFATPTTPQPIANGLQSDPRTLGVVVTAKF